MNAGAERDDGARAVTPHDPIEFLLAEHLNHRRMCRALERLALMEEFDAARITGLLDFIRFDDDLAATFYGKGNLFVE